MLAVDIHQHLWPEDVLGTLEARTEPPRATWAGGVWTVELPGEPPFGVDPADHDPAARAGDVVREGLDRALVALSTPVGIEALPAADAAPILTAWAEASAALPSPLRAWGSLAFALPPADLAAAAVATLDAGAVGIVIPAGALSDRAGLERVGPVLDVLAARLAPAFVHPGPAPWQTVFTSGPGSGVNSDVPWWGPVIGYPTQLHAAWHTWTAWGRAAHPGLRVVFAALAGLAPLHAERSALRGGPATLEPDPLVFYDSSGYGPRALRFMACAAGSAQLVHGTDRPVVATDPLAGEPLGPDVHTAMRTDAVARLLGAVWVAA